MQKTSNHIKAPCITQPRGSKYPIFDDSGPKYHRGYGFWNQKPQVFGTWTLWARVFGLPGCKELLRPPGRTSSGESVIQPDLLVISGEGVFVCIYIYIIIDIYVDICIYTYVFHIYIRIHI